MNKNEKTVFKILVEGMTPSIFAERIFPKQLIDEPYCFEAMDHVREQNIAHPENSKVAFEHDAVFCFARWRSYKPNYPYEQTTLSIEIKKFKESTIDHIVPLANGGKNEPVNAICSCINCNRQKGDLSIKQFIRKYSKKRRTAYLNCVRCLFEGDKISDEKHCRLLGDFSEEPKTTRLNFKLGRFRLLGRFYVSPVSSL